MRRGHGILQSKTKEDQMRTTQPPRTMGFPFAPTDEVSDRPHLKLYPIGPTRLTTSFNPDTTSGSRLSRTIPSTSVTVSTCPLSKRAVANTSTSLSTRQACEFGERLVALADEIETEAMQAS